MSGSRSLRVAGLDGDSMRVEDTALLRAFLRAHSFATLTCPAGSVVLATDLPLLLDDGPNLVLRGHVRRAEVADHRLDNRDVLAVFHGPSAYIASTVFEQPPYLPAWNYAAVHARGNLRVTTEPAAIERILGSIVEQLEPAYADHWRRLTAEYGEVLLQDIAALEIRVTHLVGHFQLGQAHSTGERRRIASLLARGDASARGVAELVRTFAHRVRGRIRENAGETRLDRDERPAR